MCEVLFSLSSIPGGAGWQIVVEVIVNNVLPMLTPGAEWIECLRSKGGTVFLHLLLQVL